MYSDFLDYNRYSIIGHASEGQYFLLIENVNATEDEGGYQCQVSDYNLISSKGQLTVISKAMWILDSIFGHLIGYFIL